MATPKLNRIYDQFVRGIGTRWETSFDVDGSSAIPDSNLIQKEIIPKYINAAISRFFFEIVLQFTPKDIMLKFPELVKKTSALVFTAGVWAVGDNYKNIFVVTGAWTKNNEYISIWDAEIYPIAKTQQNRSYIATTSQPALIQLDNSLHVFPTSVSDVHVQYIAKLVDPTTGGEFIQNGSNDIPLSYHHLDKLSQIAIELYKQASMETT